MALRRSTASQSGIKALRQDNLWLHSWLGLLFGWLCYLIFFTGTLSFFREELNFWSWPEVHQFSDDHEPVQLDMPLGYLQHNASQARQWSIDLPDSRTPYVRVSWREPTVNNQRGERKSAYFDPQTGQTAEPRQSRLFNFLYRMHFELFAMPRNWGRWIMGIVTMAMLVTLISGVVIHKRLIADMFTFQQNKGLRSWLDFHNATAVLALPFHFIFTYSGLLLLMYLLMPWGVESQFDGDFRALSKADGSKRGRIVKIEPASSSPVMIQSSPLSNRLEQLIESGAEHWPEGIGQIRINRSDFQPDSITLTHLKADSLVNRARSLRWTFDAKTGVLSYTEKSPAPDAFTRQFYNVTTALHLQRYADPLQRWLFFLGGLMGTLMVATGLHIWITKRPVKPNDRISRKLALRLSGCLNSAVIAGLAFATVIAMWGNRLIPAELVNREQAEINLFFISWALTVIYSWLRPYRQALTELMFISGALLFALALFNGFLMYPSVSWHLHNSLVLITDVCCLVAATLLIFGAKSLRQQNARNKPTASAKRRAGNAANTAKLSEAR